MNANKMKRILWVIVSGVLLFGWACNDQPNIELRLTPAERNRIDTLYNARLDSLRPIWDSLCDANYQTLVRNAVDSIVKQRLQEEKRLRARNYDQ